MKIDEICDKPCCERKIEMLEGMHTVEISRLLVTSFRIFRCLIFVFVTFYCIFFNFFFNFMHMLFILSQHTFLIRKNSPFYFYHATRTIVLQIKYSENFPAWHLTMIQCRWIARRDKEYLLRWIIDSCSNHDNHIYHKECDYIYITIQI